MGIFPEGYKVPSKSSQYYKFTEGDNKVRILGPAVVGWEGWVNNTPFRRPGQECNITPNEVSIDEKTGRPKIKPFAAFPIWSYNDKAVKILSVTQVSILEAIENYEAQEEYGDARGYDLNIKRAKENGPNMYSVMALPPKPVDKKFIQAYEESDIDMKKIFDGEYPMGNPPTREEVEDKDPLFD